MTRPFHPDLRDVTADDVLVLAQALDDHLFNVEGGWEESRGIIDARLAAIARIARMLGRSAKNAGLAPTEPFPFKRCCKCGALMIQAHLPDQDERCDDCKDPG